MAGLQFLAGGVIQFTDNSGNPLAAGTINTYTTGTNTDKTTYTDSARTIAAANPLTLDSNGKAKMYLALNGEYRLLLKTSAGATVDTLDNIAAQQKTHQGCLVTNGSNQSTTNNVALTLAYTAETYDTGAFHDNSVNNDRITIPTGSGITKVRLWAYLYFAANVTGSRRISILKNGADFYLQNTMAVTTAGSATYLIMSTPIVTVAETDYFGVTAYQDSGGALNVSSTQFMMEVIE